MSGTKQMLDKVCFVSIDVESEYGDSKGVEKLDKILEIFKKNNISATLFINGELFPRYNQKIKEWGINFEIASHSFSHRFWDTLGDKERKEEIAKFLSHYQKIFNQKPKGFRAPSHIIDEKGIAFLTEQSFLYDSSILPHYPFFKKYRGYRGKAPLFPYWKNKKLLEIPVAGLSLGIPLVGTWISKLPFFVYRFLISIKAPRFLTFNLHSWDSLNPKLLEKLEKIFKILRRKNYRFLNGIQIYELFSENRK